jgi:hypothetical protein
MFRRRMNVVEAVEDILADAVVDHALALDRALLLRVEGGGVILEILDQRAWFGPFIENFGLAFVDLTAARHERFLDLEKATPRPWQSAEGSALAGATAAI